MNLAQSLLSELQHEAANTRKMLERIPAEKFNFKPHEKSMTMMRLAAHIAEIPGLFIGHVLDTPELDFAIMRYTPATAETTEELLQIFDQSLLKAVEALKAASEEEFSKTWTLRNGEHVILSRSKIGVIRSLGLNHVIHHRGQLSVYLRLEDLPVPGMYGPSADEMF